MKRIFFALLSLLMLSSCATVNRTKSYLYGDAAHRGEPKARRTLAGGDIKCYTDRNTNAYVRGSHSQDYTFSVSFGTIKLVNTATDYVEVYEYDSSRQKDYWVLKERVHRNGPFHDILTWTKKQPQLISFACGQNGRLFVTVHSAVMKNGKWQKWALQRSYTF